MNMLEDDLRQLETDPSDGGAWFRVSRDLRHATIPDGVLREAASRLQPLSPITTFAQLKHGDALETIKERLDEGASRAVAREARSAEEARHMAYLRMHPPAPGPAQALARPTGSEPDNESESEKEACIRAIVAERGISALLHFTRARNLPAITEHGLLPRRALENRGLPFDPNDDKRLDDAPHASCVSIGWPNYRTFYRFQHDRYPSEVWVVLEMAPDVLWELKCAFCYTNAATGCMRDLKLRHRATSSAFADLFADHDGDPKRSECCIPRCYPTNPQAEVLVFGTIPPSRVRCAYVEGSHALQSVPGTDKIPVKVDSRYFQSRSDYRLWRGHHAGHGEGDH